MTGEGKCKSKNKGKGHPITCHEGERGSTVTALLFLYLRRQIRVVVNATLGRFTPDNVAVPIVQDGE
jgi:hypothetical protein